MILDVTKILENDDVEEVIRMARKEVPISFIPMEVLVAEFLDLAADEFIRDSEPASKALARRLKERYKKGG